MFRNEILEAYGNGMIEQDAMGQLACDNFSLGSILKAIERGWIAADVAEEIIQNHIR